MINLLLANNCELNCEYCYQKKNHDRNKMSLDFVKRNFDNLKKNEFFHLFGGEPFNNKEVIEWFSKKKGVKFKITTNVKETDLNTLTGFMKNSTLKHLKLSLAPLGAFDRYNKKDEKIVISKVKKIINMFKSYKFGILELHFVFTKKTHKRMYRTYAFFSNMIIKEKCDFDISFSFDTSEYRDNNEIDKILYQYKKIINFDLINFFEIKIKNLIPKEYRFCTAKNQKTYNGENILSGCPRMIYESIKLKDSSKCDACKNEYCYSCFLIQENDCIFFSKIKDFMLKELDI